MSQPFLPILFVLTGQSLTLPMSVRVSAIALPPAKNNAVVHVSVWPHSTNGPPLASKHLVITNGEGRTDLRVPAGQYLIKIEAPGFWAPDYPINVSSTETPAADLRLWPTSELTFELATESHKPLPLNELTMQFRGAPTIEEKVRVPAGRTMCRVVERRATCVVPVGRIDFQVTSTPPAPALIPEYFWDVEHRLRDQALLRRLRFVSGSSLIGYVRNEGGEPAAGARVELRTPTGRQIEPTATGFGTAEPNIHAPEERQSRLYATTNQRGFFQVRQPLPGEYRVVATDENGASAQRTVILDADRETALGDFLGLERPYELDVTIDPPVSPDGGLWSIELVRLVPVTSMARYAADDAGKALLDGVGRGQYNIYVLSGPQKYFVDAFEVEDQPGPLQIQIPLVAVRGKITLGNNPLRARLIFGGENAPRSVPLESTETGEFKGMLPQQGDWVVQIEASDPSVHRRLRRVSVIPGISNEAEVNIRLKDARLRGRVVDEAGDLVADALITLSPVVSPEDSTTHFKAETGLFELAGMSPGIVALEAETPDQRSSEPVAVTLGELEADATLVVTKPTELMGRVVSSTSSHPIPGAMLFATAANKPLTGAGLRNTDGEGRFSLRLPPKTAVTTVAYWADGYSLDITKATGGTNSETVLFASPLGGTLIVTMPDSEEMNQSMPVVVRGGAAMPPRALATIRPEDRRTFDLANSRVTIPNLAPGAYALCTMDTKAFLFGLSPMVGPDCSSGILLPNGELTLSLSANRTSR